jgi:LacI family transcriptional regulator
MKTASLEPRTCLVEHESMLTAAWLEDQVFGLHKADAILTLNWVCTILALRGLRELGKTAGRDVPMLSFDDFDLADMLTPALSVVPQPAEMLGREAATLLFQRLKGGSGEPRAVVLPTTLILRQSWGCGEQR